MEDVGVPILRRRQSMPAYMIRSSQGISSEHRPTDSYEDEPKASTLPASSPMNIPPPLKRTKTTIATSSSSSTEGGWFSKWFGSSTAGRRTSITSPPTTDPSPLAKRMPSDSVIKAHDNHTSLTASLPQIAPPQSSSRDFLFNSTGSVPHTPNSTSDQTTSQPNVPPLGRTVSGSLLGKNSKKEATPSTSPSITSSLEPDARTGLGDQTDLFWMVLRDIGE